MNRKHTGYHRQESYGICMYAYMYISVMLIILVSTRNKAAPYYTQIKRASRICACRSIFLIICIVDSYWCVKGVLLHTFLW